MVKYIWIISLVIYGILALILIINLREKNNFIKNAFVILFSLLIITFLIYNQQIINAGISFFVRFVYFPTFDSYTLMMFLTLCILLYNILDEKVDNKFKVVNYVFSSLLIVCYVVFMTMKVDIFSYNSLYSSPSLVWLRISTRIFCIWLLILMLMKYCEGFKHKRWCLWW